MAPVQPTRPIRDAAASDCLGASSPIRRVVSHRLQSADTGHSLSSKASAGFDPGCAKTRAFNLCVESSSQFGQSENQSAGDGLSEEANRENGSTLSWLAHVSTRPGPIAAVRAYPAWCQNRSLAHRLIRSPRHRQQAALGYFNCLDLRGVAHDFRDGRVKQHLPLPCLRIPGVHPSNKITKNRNPPRDGVGLNPSDPTTLRNHPQSSKACSKRSVCISRSARRRTINSWKMDAILGSFLSIKFIFSRERP
jgi:hypothetical protein